MPIITLNPFDGSYRQLPSSFSFTSELYFETVLTKEVIILNKS